MIKYFWPVMPALMIDGFQFFLSASISIIAAFPGTFAGGAAGCVAGEKVGVGCTVGGFIFGTLGSFPLINGALATVTVPLGIMLGFAITICISLTFGTFLMMLLALNGMFYPKHAIWALGELVPGVNNVPVWTTLAVRSGLTKMREEKIGSRMGGLAFSPISLFGKNFALVGHPQRKEKNFPAPEADTDALNVREARSKTPTILTDIRKPLPVKP